MTNLDWLDATATAELVRSGELKPREAVEAAIDRIERLDPALNAVIHRRFELALEEADGVDPSAPFAGVPFLLKDGVQHLAGDPVHVGMRVLRDADFRADHDTWLAARFRAAGFATLGRTNVPELLSVITTEPEAHGPARNPWSTAHSTGGSSGGAAAAVASGMVPVAHGNDMGGSIRIPASACGLVGLKPTRARTSLGPDLGELWGPLTHELVLARSVRDVAGVLDAVAGPGRGDPYTAPAPSRPWRDEVGAEPGALRIGFRTDQPGDHSPSHPACVAAVEATAAALAPLGHRVEASPVEALDDPRLNEQVPVIVGAALAREVDRWSGALGRAIELDELEAHNGLLVEMGRSVTAAGYLGGLESVHAWSRGVAAWFGDHDVLLVPTVPDLTPELGVLVPGAFPDPFTFVLTMAARTGFVFPFNATGMPAISLPLGRDDRGLPVGVQLVAPQGREDVLLRLAAQLEQAMPWSYDGVLP